MSTTNSREVISLLMLGAMVGSMVSGFALKEVGYKPILVPGPLISIGAFDQVSLVIIWFHACCFSPIEPHFLVSPVAEWLSLGLSASA